MPSNPYNSGCKTCHVYITNDTSPERTYELEIHVISNKEGLLSHMISNPYVIGPGDGSASTNFGARKKLYQRRRRGNGHAAISSFCGLVWFLGGCRGAVKKWRDTGEYLYLLDYFIVSRSPPL